ncbi:glycoside hydrolase family 9 protein [Ferrimonas kyonanensis]|uniref:glycoside hydrolase family 9 protein n=1 Tax=Ferrimonas kyonanensis TaxID=364763 RepID=UPI0006846A4E|nr:glycoside hydrolase family 9 protein [Ferrimonas kyonanensis]
MKPLLMLLALLSLKLPAQILVNQSGYLAAEPGQIKAPPGQTLLLKSASSDGIIATLSPPADGWLSLPIGLGPGWYLLENEQHRSEVFPIGLDSQKQSLMLLLRAFHYQHAGQPLLDPATGLRRPAAHLQDGRLAHDDDLHPQGHYLDASGGWYDAGDYGKYLATTTITAARLLDAGQQAESRDPLLAQALIQEAQIGLDWLLKMQRIDGAFYRKVGGASWPELVPPHQDRQPRYIYGVSTPDSAKASAVLAQAARQLMPAQPELGQRYLAAAESGWRWLQSQPQQRIDWHPGDDGGSGPYIYNQWDQQPSLQHDRDDRFWAAAELFLTTGQADYLEYASQHLPTTIDLFEWKDPSVMGVIHLLASSRAAPLHALLSERLLQRCRQLKTQAEASEFRIANQRFIWGSNKMVAEQGILLAQCASLSGDRRYRQLAWHQWHYLMGLNPFNQSFVTGLGARPVRNLHHIWARAAKVSPPGMMVGGPNEDSQASIAPKGQGMLSYVDDARDYSVNEFAIDYNAAAIGLIGQLLHGPGPHPADTAASH